MKVVNTDRTVSCSHHGQTNGHGLLDSSNIFVYKSMRFILYVTKYTEVFSTEKIHIYRITYKNFEYSPIYVYIGNRALLI